MADTEARGPLSHADWRSVTEVPEATAETDGSRAQHKDFSEKLEWGLGRCEGRLYTYSVTADY